MADADPHALRGRPLANQIIAEVREQVEELAASGWHAKLSLNTNFYLNGVTNLFVNVDNILNSDQVLNYATTTQDGTPYYLAPSAQYPQGRIYYGPAGTITPIFISFGIRSKF